MHHHWQNLNEKNGVKGNPIVNGRAWLHWGLGTGGRRSRTIGVQWSLHKRLQLGIGLTFGGQGAEHDLSVRIHLAFFSLYLHTEGVIRRFFKGYNDHAFQLEMYHLGELTLSWAWNSNPMEWRSSDPWYRSGMWHPADTFLGRVVYTEGAAEVHQVEIPMHEANYRATVTLRNDSWKRPRWYRKTIRRAHIDMLEGGQVPVPSKGENSWDCGEDGIYGMTCAARDVPEAIARVVESALRSRAKHGGRNWKPAPTVEHLGI